MICLQVRDGRLWIELGFSSFDEWIASSAPYSRSSCYAAMRTLESLKDIPAEKLEQVPRGNLRVMEKLSTAVRSDANVLEWAAKLSETAFWEKVATEYPQQHLEAPERKSVHSLPASLWALMDDCVDKAMREEGFVNRLDAIEYILSDYLVSEPR